MVDCPLYEPRYLGLMVGIKVDVGVSGLSIAPAVALSGMIWYNYASGANARCQRITICIADKLSHLTFPGSQGYLFAALNFQARL